MSNASILQVLRSQKAATTILTHLTIKEALGFLSLFRFPSENEKIQLLQWFSDDVLKKVQFPKTVIDSLGPTSCLKTLHHSFMAFRHSLSLPSSEFTGAGGKNVSNTVDKTAVIRVLWLNALLIYADEFQPTNDYLTIQSRIGARLAYEGDYLLACLTDALPDVTAANKDLSVCVEAILALPDGFDRLKNHWLQNMVPFLDDPKLVWNPDNVQADNGGKLKPELMRRSALEALQNYMQYIVQTSTFHFNAISLLLPPNHRVQMVTAFLSEVFEHALKQRLTSMLQTAKDQDLNNGRRHYLRCLQLVVSGCHNLINSACEMFSELDASHASRLVDTVLDAYQNEYIDMELGFLQAQFTIELDKWSKASFHNEPWNVPNNLNHVMTKYKQLFLQRAKLLTSSTVTILTSAAVNGLPPTAPNDDDSIPQPNFFRRSISNDLLFSLLSIHLESVDRCSKIANSSNITKWMTKIYSFLLKFIGHQHVRPNIEKSAKKLEEFDDKIAEDPLLEFFGLIHLLDLLIHILDIYYFDRIKPFVDESNVFCVALKEKKEFETMLDEYVAIGLERGLNILVRQVESVLHTEQLDDDFNSELTNRPSMQPTMACQHVVQLLTEHTNLLHTCTDAPTLGVYFNEVTARLYTSIISHLKKQTIKAPYGALQLIADMNSYYSFVSSQWSRYISSENLNRFATIKDIGNMFLIDGDGVRGILMDQIQRFQGILTTEELLELMARRWDWPKIKRQVDVNGCCIS